MRGATGVTIQPQHVLRLSRRKTRMLNPRHTLNVSYNARSNSCQDRTSPNIAPATKNDIAKFQRNSGKTGETSFLQCGDDPRPFRDHSEHETVSPQPASQPRLLFALAASIPTEIFTFRNPALIQKFAKCCTCHDK